MKFKPLNAGLAWIPFVCAAFFISTFPQSCGKKEGKKNENQVIQAPQGQEGTTSDLYAMVDSFSTTEKGFSINLSSSSKSASGISYECQINEAAFQPCDSSYLIGYDKVLPGQNALFVKAKQGQKVSPPLQYKFFYTPIQGVPEGHVDIVPPKNVTTLPVANVDSKISLVHDAATRTVNFTSTLSEPNLSYECKFGSPTIWTKCNSPILYDNLETPGGSTTLEVRAVTGNGSEVYSTKPFPIEIKQNELDIIYVQSSIDTGNDGWQGQKQFQFGQNAQIPQQGSDLGLDIIQQYAWQELIDLTFYVFNTSTGDVSSGGDYISVSFWNAKGQEVRLGDKKIVAGISEISFRSSDWQGNFGSSFLMADISGISVKLNGNNAQLLSARAGINRGIRKIRTQPNLILTSGSVFDVAGLSWNGQLNQSFLNQTLLSLTLESRLVASPYPQAKVEFFQKTVNQNGSINQSAVIDPQYRDIVLPINKRFITEIYDLALVSREPIQILSSTSKLRSARLVKINPVGPKAFILGGRNNPTQKQFAFNIGTPALGGALGQEGSINSSYCGSKVLEVVVFGKRIEFDGLTTLPTSIQVSLPKWGQLGSVEQSTERVSAYSQVLHLPFQNSKLDCNNADFASLGSISLSQGAFQVNDIYAVLQLP